MSTTIDKKVVEMRFDNKQFEEGTRQTMSTLDKLKAALTFKGASKGLEDISKAANNVNMNGLASGIQTVEAKFSALEVIGTTALVRITNAAIDTGAALVKSFTIDNVMAGWEKMGSQMGYVQTLVNSTGKSSAEVQEYLDQLAWFADETSYGFSDMSSALSNMAATGGDLDKLVPMIRGIANATAFAGKGAAEFSRVIYNLNQSYGAGHITWMDWKSIEQAGVASKQLKEEIIKAGEELGTIQKNQVTIGNFGTTLKDNWATTAVMEKAFGKFDELSAAAYQAVKNGEFDTASEAMAALAGDYNAIAVKAFQASQQAKTFKEATDAVAEAASTQWNGVFTAIFGNYERQVQIFTDLANWLYKVFVSPVVNFREKVEKAFNVKPFEDLIDRIKNNKMVKAFEEINNKIKTTSHTLEEYQKMVDRVWRGDFKNQPYRKALVEEQGYNYSAVQSLVNLGADRNGYYTYYRITMDDVTKAEKKYGVVTEQSTEVIETQTKAIDDLTEEELEAMGLKEDEIEMFLMLSNAAKKYGLSIDDLIDKMKKRDARSLLFGKQATDENGKGIFELDENGKPTDKKVYEIMGVAQNLVGFFTNIFAAIKKAWSETFEEITSIDIYMFIDKLNRFTESLRAITDDPNSQGMKNLTDAFKGLFAILKLIHTVMHGGFTIAWTIFKTVLQTLGYDVLDFAGALGNVISRIVNFITENEFVIKGVVWLTKLISGAIIKVHNFVTQYIDLNMWVEKVCNALSHFKDWLGKIGKSSMPVIIEWFKKLCEWLSKVKDWLVKVTKNGFKVFIKDLQKFFEGLKTAENIPKYIFDSIIAGFKKYGGNALNAISKLLNKFRDTISSKFNIDKGNGFFSFGVNCVKGLVNGLKSGSGNAIKAFAEWASKILKTFAEKMGIHSPSTVFYEYGKNIIMGLYNGISELAHIVFTLVKSIGEKLIEIVKDMDLGTIVAALLSAGIVIAVLNIAGAAAKLANSLASFTTAFSDLADAVKFKAISGMITSMAIAIGVLVAAIWTLSKIQNPWVIIGEIIAIGVLMGLIAGITVFISKNFETQDIKGIATFALVVLALGLAMKSMAKAFVRIAGLKDINYWAIVQFIGLIAVFVIAALLLSNKEATILKAGGTLLAMAAAIYLMSMVVKKIGKMPSKVVEQGVAVLVVFAALIIAFMYVTKLINGSKNVEKIGGMLMSIGVAFYLMAMTVKKLGKMSYDDLSKGFVVLGGFVTLIILLMAATQLIVGSKNVDKIGKALLGISAVFLVMAIAVKILGRMKIGNIAKGMGAVLVFIGFVAYIIKKLSEYPVAKIEGVAKALLGISAIILVMTFAVTILGLLPVENLVKGIAAVGFLTLFVGLLIEATADAKDGLGSTLWPIVAAITILSVALGILSLIPFEKLMSAATSMAVVMLSLGFLIRSIAELPQLDGKMLWNILKLIAVISLIAGVIVALSYFAPQVAIQSAASLAILLITLTGALFILSKINLSGDSAKGLLGLVMLVGVVYLLVGALMLLSDVNNVIPSVLALTTLMLTLTAVLVAVSVVGLLYAATGGVAAAGLLGLVAIIGCLYLVIGAVALLSNMKNAETGINNMNLIITSLLNMLVKLAVVGPLAILGTAALYGLVALMAPLLLLTASLGLLVSALPVIATFVTKGLNLLVQLATGLGEMIGAFISGALTKLSEGLPQVGTNLAQFMINATPFFTLTQMINKETLKAVEILAGAILILTGTNILNSIGNFLTGGKGFAQMGAELSLFMMNATPFLMASKLVNESCMNGVKALAEAILILTGANLIEGLSKWVTGGRMSLASFGTQLPGLGEAISGFVSHLDGFDDSKVKIAECAGNVIKALAEAANSLPKENGLWQAIFGQSTGLTQFANDMPVVADGVNGFIDKLKDFDDGKVRIAQTAADIIKALADCANSLPKENGFWQKLFGSNSLKDFANNMPTVADGVNKFIEKLKDIDESKTKVAAAAGEIIKGIAEIGKVDIGNLKDKKLKDVFTDIADGIANYIDKLKDYTDEDVQKAISISNQITEATTTMTSTIDQSFKDNTGSLVTSAENMAKNTASGLTSDSVMSTLKNQGLNFVKGFAGGISDNKSIASSAAGSMGTDALNKLQKVLDIHSPSRKSRKLGGFFGLGFVNGVTDMASRVYDATENVGDQATKGLMSTIANITNLIDDDINTSPVITPVLDLSDVTSNAKRLDSLFGNQSIQLASNLSSISTGMNARNQNGNENVIAALDKLGSKLGKTNGNTYNINGVTYDDGSSVQQAVSDLIRAIEVERRV